LVHSYGRFMNRELHGLNRSMSIQAGYSDQGRSPGTIPVVVDRPSYRPGMINFVRLPTG
jgi:hypothetical protein